jgi:hypothetical protein
VKQICVGSEFALVDDCDYEEVSKHTWQLKVEGTRKYAVRCECNHGHQQTIRMHQPIIARMGLDRTGMDIDHRDRCGLNNCRANLRLASRSQNNANMSRHKDNMSGVKGVDWHKRTNKWRARIACNGKHHHLGLFTNLQDAGKAYNAAALKYFGEFARLNPL